MHSFLKCLFRDMPTNKFIVDRHKAKISWHIFTHGVNTTYKQWFVVIVHRLETLPINVSYMLVTSNDLQLSFSSNTVITM